jgi:hypothetical protein|nr:MAG TPA: hypothetical protein [Herelleviridae sp.]
MLRVIETYIKTSLMSSKYKYISEEITPPMHPCLNKNIENLGG